MPAMVMITREGGDAKVNEAKAAGADGLISKPFTPDKIQQAIKEFVK